MSGKINFKDRITEFESLLNSLSKENDFSNKLKILKKLPAIKTYLSDNHWLESFLKSLNIESEYVIKSMIAIGQGPIVLNPHDLSEKETTKRLIATLEQLLDIEFFYAHMGGIIGYHLTILKLLYEHDRPFVPPPEDISFNKPEGLSLDKNNHEVRQTIRSGIENIDKIAMFYPLGGAGERLSLKDDETGNPLPAVVLPFLGRSLLEGMIRDLQAFEYLSFKLSGVQSLTPIAMMTSTEKDNNLHVLNICKSCNWFGRPSESFHFFTQPLVPVITCEGNWSLSEPLTPLLKPSGHGVLWKLAEESGVFQWLESLGRDQCLIRQINNPLASSDCAIIALAGKGCLEKKAFGFLSCERLLGSDEGTNVLIEKKTPDGYDYSVTNIEYTDFSQKGIGEKPSAPGKPFSIYPTNTNILFADIPSIRKALKLCQIPGQLINMKTKVPYLNPEGKLSYVLGGRLESTMQNIADSIVDHFPRRLTKKECKDDLSVFVLYHPRAKTISVTKKHYQSGQALIGTPEQAYYDLLTNHHSLLKSCLFNLPEWESIEKQLVEGPSCIFLFHPALGPNFSIISQKIRGGSLTPGSELQLEIAEIDIENLNLDGSLIIHSHSPLGTSPSPEKLQYGNECKCTLHNVVIRNQGIDRKKAQDYWKNALVRKEEVKIILHEGAEFHADGVVLEGAHFFEVPAHHRLVLRPDGKESWKQELFPISKPTWTWRYFFDEEDVIKLEMSRLNT